MMRVHRFLAFAIALALAGNTSAQDHAEHQHHPAPPPGKPTPVEQHAPTHEEPAAAMDHAAMDHGQYQPPPLTDADRAAAFPDLAGHDMGGHMDDDPLVSMV